MRAKQLPKGTWSKSIRYFYSIKNRARFWCESLLERDAMLRLEFDDEVEAYKAQPMSFAYKNSNGKIARYTPDLLVKMKSGKGFVFREVKPSKRVDDSLRTQIQWIGRHIQNAYGSQLEIVTDDEIRDGHRIDNLNILYPYKRVHLDPTVACRVLRDLPEEFDFAKLKAMANHLGHREVIPFAIMAHGLVKFDASIPLGDQTRLYKA